MKIGLRIDVDTFRGTREGVPALCRMLADHGVSASFFFSVGPDNMGRKVWQLVRPGFLWKMLRTRASQLYGWDILLKGALWPGPLIGERLGDVIRSVSGAGHEVGLHAWDHHWWQTRAHRANSRIIQEDLKRGMDSLARITGHAPVSSAAPGWRCTERVIQEKARFSFLYNSDCRGESLFYPVVAGTAISQVQIPVTLPTYDEVIGRGHVRDDQYNAYLFSLLRPQRLNVLTIHAEVEGIGLRGMFEAFLRMSRSAGAQMVPLGRLLADDPEITPSRIVQREIEGRAGWVCCQASEGARP